MNSSDSENSIIPLTGGGTAASVVRIGDHVHRSLPPNHVFTHKVLKHLAEKGVVEVPRFLGISEKGQEILTFIEGEVPRGWDLSEDQVEGCLMMMKRFHDACTDFPDLKGAETIVHQDLAPWNVIFRGETPVGIIDLDDCRPGRRVEDVAYFLWTFLEFGNVEVEDDNMLEQIQALCECYGLQHVSGLVEALLDQQSRILSFRENVVATSSDPAAREFSAGAVERIQKSMDWVRRNRKSLEEISDR